ETAIKLFIDDLVSPTSSHDNYLNFAWEFDFEKSKSSIINAQLYHSLSMVIIGYSFPYYNRKVDKLILESFLISKSNILNRITFYLQYPTIEECDRIKRKIISIINSIKGFENFIGLEKTFVPIYTEDQFYIPNELLQ
ncbi:MAG: hypothetical protein RIQ33_1608, partial [Bacteroidota bacterium]